MSWKSGSSSTVRSYQFLYDNQNFLTWATYLENNTANSRYMTRYVYDSMGNITTLWRYGLRDNNTYGLIDNLSYTYNGNQLVTVTDGRSGPDYSGAFHFSDGADEDVEYEYDQNGNLTKDLNKKITQIKYNLLNLPSMITYNSNKDYKFVYDATGRKLSAVFGTTEAYVGPVTPFPHGITLIDEPMADITSPLGGGIGSHPVIGDSAYVNPGHGGQWGELLIDQNFQYCGNIFYSNGKVNRIFFDGGYVTFTNSQPVYHYYLQDHLGNNRVIVNENDSIEQVNHYYPFGALFGESTGGDKNRYKYNGKELDRLKGIDLYDYGARWYNAASIHWTSVDPMCEKYYNTSPYVYCHNNPILRIDPSGAYDFKGLVKNNSYNIAVVITTKYEKNRAMNSDFNAAQKNGIPVILVENISDFANALNSMSQMGISVNTFSINSHGQAAGYNTPANFYIGEENVNINTDFSSLKSGLEGKNVFINACRVGVENNFSIDLSTGQNLIEHIAEQTGSDVFAPCHRVLSGYPFNGSRTLNGPVNQNAPDGPLSEFTHSNKGSLSEIVNNLRISRFLGLEYDDENGWKHNK